MSNLKKEKPSLQSQLAWDDEWETALDSVLEEEGVADRKLRVEDLFKKDDDQVS